MKTKKSIRLSNNYWHPKSVCKAINQLLLDEGLALRLTTEDLYIRLNIVKLREETCIGCKEHDRRG